MLSSLAESQEREEKAQQNSAGPDDEDEDDKDRKLNVGPDDGDPPDESTREKRISQDQAKLSYQDVFNASATCSLTAKQTALG